MELFITYFTWQNIMKLEPPSQASVVFTTILADMSPKIHLFFKVILSFTNIKPEGRSWGHFH